jgi:hypothetical protein
MYSGNVVSESSKFMFYGVVLKEADGCISGGWFAEYVNFKVRRFLDYK